MQNFLVTTMEPALVLCEVFKTREGDASWTLKPRYATLWLSFDCYGLLELLQGVRQIKKTDLNPVYLFISPPSMEALRSRLKRRGTETDASVGKRLATALKEIAFAKEPSVHDVVIVNDDLDRAYELFKTVARGEEVCGDTLPPLED